MHGDILVIHGRRRCRLDYLFFFMYSFRAFSSSSLTFLAEPVLFTTNLIHSCQVALSILMEVLAFSELNTHQFIVVVNKVNGIYHKAKIGYGIMVMWYYGNKILRRICMEADYTK